MGNRYREEVLRVELLPLTIDLSLFRRKKLPQMFLRL